MHRQAKRTGYPLILMMILILNGPTLVNAQDPNVSIGFKLMPGLTRCVSPEHYKYFKNNREMMPTFGYGLSLGIPLGHRRVAFETGIYMLDRGAKCYDSTFNQSGTTGNISYMNGSDVDIHYYYITLPFMIKFFTRHFNIAFGPSFEYKLYNKWVYTGNNNETIIGGLIRHSGPFNNINTSGVAIASYDLPVSPSFIFSLEGRAEVSDIFEYQEKEYFYSTTYYLGFGMRYLIGKKVPAEKVIYVGY